MKRTLVLSLIFISVSVFAISCYYLSLNLSYIKYDVNDYELCSEFENNLESEIETLVDEHIDEFIDDLLGIGMVFNSLIGNDEEFVAGVWEKHFGKPMEKIVDDRVGVLKYQLLENNYALCSELAVEESSGVKTFDKRIREAFLDSFNKQGISTSLDTGSIAIPSNVVSLSAGIAAGGAVTFALKKTLLAAIVGFIVEESVDSIVAEEISESIKPKILESIKSNLYMALHSKDGLYDEIKKSISLFHDERNKRLGRRVSLDQLQKNAKFFISSPDIAANMYAKVIYEDSVNLKRDVYEVVN